MSQPKKGKKGIGCVIAAVVCGIVISIAGIFIIAIILFIAAPTLLNAADKVKGAAVKANMSAAASTVVTNISVKEYPVDQAVSGALTTLNNADTPDDTSDDAFSPFEESYPAFSDTPGPGVVTINVIGPSSVEITGYDKNIDMIDTKIIDLPKN